MKKLVLTAAIMFALISCSGNKYSVTGEFDDDSFEGKTAYLINYDTQDTIDSTVVKQKEFSFSGEINTPSVTRLIIKGAQGTKAMFVLEGGDITIDTQKRNATGTELNEAYAQMNKTEKDLEEIYIKAKEDLDAEIISREQFDTKSLEFGANMDKLYKETYNNNKNNPIGYYAFLNYTFNFNSAQFDSIMADADEDLAKMKRVQTWIEGAAKKERTAVGKKFIDFVVVSEDGMKTSLSDFVGKGDYVLVYFWASWCGPCIREGEIIKELYTEYQDKGLNVLGVAVWDDPEKTRAAIKKHELPWQQIINAQRIPTDIYGITGIPHIILFAPDGTILSRGLQGDKLKEKVKEVMNAKI